MTSKKLTGWLLIIGTVGTLVVFIGLGPAVFRGARGGTATEALAALMNNEILSRVLIILGAILFSAQVAGFALIANSMKVGNKAGAGVASLASICFTVVITVVVLSNAFELGMMDLGSDDLAAATSLYQSGNGLGEAVGYFLPIAVLLLGIGIMIQKNFHAAIGWIFVILGIVTFLRQIIGLGGVVGLAQWIITSIFTIIVGIVVLRSK